MALWIVVVLVVVLLPIAYLVWRFRSGDEAVGGGSLGRQYFGRDDDDWGPKSS
jgi:hypothetical protein